MEATWWNWTDAGMFIAFFVAIRIAFLWLATQAIVALIPEGNRCLTCGEETLPLVHEGGWHLLGHRFHRRFCLSCQWEGIARTSKTRRVTRPPPQSGTRPTSREAVRR